MKENKSSFSSVLKKRVLPVVLVGGIAIGLININKGRNQSEVNGYNVEESSNYRSAGQYSYLIDTSCIETENVEDRINFAQIIETEDKSSSSWKTSFTSNFYTSNIMVILPDEYAGYASTVFGKDNFDIIYTSNVYQTLQGEIYTVIKTEYSAKRYLDLEGINVYELEAMGLKEFQEGDILGSTIVYYQGQMVAFDQYGVGSTAENVKSAMIGDADSLVTEVTLDASVDVTLTELDEIEYSLNQEKTKTLN